MFRATHRSISPKGWAAALFLFAAVGFAETIHFDLVIPDIVFARLRSCPRKDVDRQQQLQSFFAEAGCRGTALTLDQPRHSKFGNVICTLPGSSPEEIVVGAHFDHVDRGAGAVDNWSGASLLPSLYQALATVPRKHTFVFIGFYGEEQGMVGSQEYVRTIGKDGLARIDAMVNMDTLGLGSTEIWASHADPVLVKDAYVISSTMKLPLSIVNVDRVGSTDSESFRDKKVPSITFHTLTQSTLHILHTTEDQLSQIKEDDYYDNYHLLSAYLSFLDQVVQSRSSSELAK